jgi:hypothetical protein
MFTYGLIRENARLAFHMMSFIDPDAEDDSGERNVPESKDGKDAGAAAGVRGRSVKILSAHSCMSSCV